MGAVDPFIAFRAEQTRPRSRDGLPGRAARPNQGVGCINSIPLQIGQIGTCDRVSASHGGLGTNNGAFAAKTAVCDRSRASSSGRASQHPRGETECSAPRYVPTVNEPDLERKAQVAQLLLDAARVLGETLDPERVYDRFHDLLTGVIQHDGVVVSSYDAEDGLIRCEYAWSDGNRLDHTTLPPLPLNQQGEGMQSRVIVTGEPLLLNDVVEHVQRPGGTYYDVDS